jgi:hypothetical protein
MLPSFRLIIATFLAGFVLAAAAVQFVGSARVAHDGLAPQAAPAPMRADASYPAGTGSVDWRQADVPVPVIFDLRFAADMSAIAANPVGLAWPAAHPPPSVATPSVAPPSAAGPDVAAPRIASEPDPAPAAPAIAPDDGLTGELPEESDPYPLASLSVAPSVAATPAAAPAPIAPSARAAANRAARPAVQPRLQPRIVRRAPPSEPNTSAAANPLWNLFGSTPQAPQ